jgi:hypothetical protein
VKGRLDFTQKIKLSQKNRPSGRFFQTRNFLKKTGRNFFQISVGNAQA